MVLLILVNLLGHVICIPFNLNVIMVFQVGHRPLMVHDKLKKLNGYVQ
ncbi:unnamed protein product [Brassica rapa]|uniref:Uncharacterized protein n=2 Tax=Brassica TaxID=3705 RepID=A0A8D9DHV0_BRACM|nr:unnamed protein product [Brassica napus]CAG7874269.1 unnamed protein product [Brassica rapa]